MKTIHKFDWILFITGNCWLILIQFWFVLLFFSDSPPWTPVLTRLVTQKARHFLSKLNYNELSAKAFSCLEYGKEKEKGPKRKVSKAESQKSNFENPATLFSCPGDPAPVFQEAGGVHLRAGQVHRRPGHCVPLQVHRELHALPAGQISLCCRHVILERYRGCQRHPE